MSTSQRLDRAIEARGLLPSRARARDAVLRGTVAVNGHTASKPNQTVTDADRIELNDQAAPYVSRAALKLQAGLDKGKIEVTDRICLDVGASTGGFTQVLLERGARKVYAVDVGREQLHPDLRSDPRVVSLEGINARDLDNSLILQSIDLLVCDVSFVSVTKVLERPLQLCGASARAVILFKPQFEVGRAFVGKRGIVTDSAAIEKSLHDVMQFLAERGWALVTSLPSPIAGGDGNQETVLVMRRQIEG